MKKPTLLSKGAQAMGRIGGARNTKDQIEARAKNQKRAGRPGRVCTTCGQPVKGGHKDVALDQSCGQHGWHWVDAVTRRTNK